LRDCRYPSLSPTNDRDANFAYANIEYQNDSVPGSHVNQAPPSLAKQRFIRVRLLGSIFPIGIQPISQIAAQFALGQNYPNPFNPVTKIRFSIPKNEYVTLRLYDVAGRLVRTLINEKVSAGTHEYEFDASDLATGLYLYTITAGDFKDTKKMVLIK